MLSLRVLMDLSYINNDAYERSCPRLPSEVLCERLILSVAMSSAQSQACVEIFLTWRITASLSTQFSQSGIKIFPFLSWHSINPGFPVDRRKSKMSSHLTTFFFFRLCFKSCGGVQTSERNSTVYPADLGNLPAVIEQISGGKS